MFKKYVHTKLFDTYLLGGTSQTKFPSERRPVDFNTLLKHEENELKNAHANKDINYEWCEFEYHLNKIKENLPNKEQSETCYHTFWLGYYAGSLSHVIARYEQLNALESMSKQAASQRALIYRNICRSQLTLLAQNLAVLEWKKPEHSETKVTAMSEIIWNLLIKYGGKDYEDMRKEVPKTHEGIKSWISAIAPEFAKKGGRPKK